MGRELKRKQIKREGKNIKDIRKEEEVKQLSFEITTKKTIITLLVVLLAVILLYLFIGLFITKDIKWFSNNNKEETTATVENTILAKNTLRQAEEEYYVYFYDFDNENTDIASSFASKMYAFKMYRVNTNDSFNANFVVEENSNTIVNNIDDLKVITPTLVKVVSGSIVESYETADKIIEFLNS